MLHDRQYQIENEKNYPDLETLISMSDEFNISLDAMLKEDKQMAEKLNKEIKFSQTFKRKVVVILICILIVVALGAIGCGIIWNNEKNTLEKSLKMVWKRIILCMMNN